jgi:hypothetical protein
VATVLDGMVKRLHDQSAKRKRGTGGPTGETVEISALAVADPRDRRASRRLQDLPPGQPRRKAMDEVRRSARSVRVDPHISTCTIKPADLVSLQVGAGRPPLIAAPCRPDGNEFRRTSEDSSDAAFERRVVTDMPISLPKTHNELVRVPVLDYSGNGGCCVRLGRRRLQCSYQRRPREQVASSGGAGRRRSAQGSQQRRHQGQRGQLATCAFRATPRPPLPPCQAHHSRLRESATTPISGPMRED